MLGRYRLDAVIGRGGMGVVFRAVDERLDRTVAIKVLAPDLVGDPLVQERFLREARVAAAIEHPHIVPVFEAASAGGVDYIAMRFVPGSDLGRVLRREAPLDLGRTLTIVEQVADALDAAHAQSLVHRDVKPSNVLLEDRGGEWAWLSDFGLTKRMDGSMQLTRDGLVGTLEYVAPEVIERGTVDGRSDQYALACVAYHCLAGRPPFVARSEAQLLHAHLHDTAPPVAGIDAEPGDVDAVIRRGLAKQPAERFPSCRAFSAELRRAVERARATGAAIVTGSGAAAAAPAARSDGPVPVMRGRRRLVLGAIVLAGAVAGSMYLVSQPREGTRELGLAPSSSPPASRAPTPSTPGILVAGAPPGQTPSATDTPLPSALVASGQPTPRATPTSTILTGEDGVIVFAARSGGDYDIWAVRPDGTGLTRLTKTSNRDERTPSVSGDGTRLVYSTGDDGDRDVWFVDLAGDRREIRLTSSVHDDFAPAISPDGERIAIVSDRSGAFHIWVMTDTGDGFDRRARRATDVTDQPATIGNDSQEPAWYPNARRLAFQSNDLDSPDIWTVNVERETRELVYAGRWRDLQPTVGPDGTIVFIRERSALGGRTLVRMGPGDAAPERVSNLRDPTDVDYSPHTQRLVVARKGAGLVTMSDDGDDRRDVRIRGLTAITDPDWVESVIVP
jgi:serine/threonine-protein kinase